MSRPIEDYALIGDCQSAALVSREGSIDWLCLPRFDSGACFAALVGTPENGRWILAPEATVREVRRRYRDETLVLETEYTTDEGVVRVTDFMPVRTTLPDLVRIVEGVEGRVTMRTDLAIRFDYGSIVPWVRRTEEGIRATGGPDTLHCRTPVALEGRNRHTVGSFAVEGGERVPFTLTWSPSREGMPPYRDPEESLEGTVTWWRNWSGRCTYEGEWRDAVLRSLITLKAMTYAPTGGLVAAPTTSLPEALGGSRNWDYRYCWLRDSTFALYALVNGGYEQEAARWQRWLVNAVAGEPSEARIMYGLAGERRLPELELGWLAGYRGSTPVRVGNKAHEQFQLDVYGEVIDTLDLCRRQGIEMDPNAWRVERAMLRFLEDRWNSPDEGIWEVRCPPKHFTHSKVMAWLAFDRGVRAVENFGLDGDRNRWRSFRDRIREQVLGHGFNPRVNSFVQHYDSDLPDASLLMLPLVGFVPADDPKMLGTLRLIERTLVEDGLVRRYAHSPEVDGLPHGEGSFLLCTFWYVDNLALVGRRDEARKRFEDLLGLRNDVGLLSEEYDPRTGCFLGNFPQTFSHVGLINTACNLQRDGGPARDRSANA